MTFKEVNLKEIGKVTSFTRTSIYNYFESKEEIFLAIFEDEYIKWTLDIQKIIDDEKIDTREILAGKLSDSLGKRKLMLKLLSVNLYDMAENSRIECLVSFMSCSFRPWRRSVTSGCMILIRERQFLRSVSLNQERGYIS